MVCPACGTTTSGSICAVCSTASLKRDAAAAAARSADTAAAAGSATSFQTVGTATSFQTGWSPAESTGGRPVHHLLASGQMFGTRYRIVRLLGEGGMGAVYEALDLELGVSVALKTIRPEITADPETAHAVEMRFKRELLLARKVTHPNVVRIYDLGEIDGTKYISMSYIDGVDLASTLRRDGALPVARALRIARSIATGLAAAHQAGVVHRDLKPANIMINADGEALIMDFGIARSTGGADTSEAARARPVPSALADRTVDGAVVGTVPYMAPEQLTGSAVDERADVYAFGLIVYDMLTTERLATVAKNPYTELLERGKTAPAAVASIAADVPPALDAIVTRCLQPLPEGRYRNAAELVDALARLDEEGHPLPAYRRVTRRQLIAAAAVVIGLLGATWQVARPTPPRPAPEPRSVLVADFVNQTGDPVFEGAVEQALTIAMEAAPYVSIFRTSNARALAAELTPDKSTRITEDVGQLIARREGINILLAGAIALDDEEYRITLQAKDPATGTAIVSVERTADDKAQVLTTLVDMTVSVREALGESRSEMERAAAAETVTAGSLEAMRAYARGQELALANKAKEALEQYQLAVKLDPSLGRAYAGMGVIYTNIFKDFSQAEANYKQALKHLDRMTERERYRTFGTYYLNVARNFEQAIENYEELVRKYPADDAGHGNLGYAYLLVGDLPRAAAEVKKALEIYPRNSLQRYNYAMYAMYASEFATAKAEAARLEKENPTFEYNLIPLSISQLALGEVEAAAETRARLAGISPLGAAFAASEEADTAMYFGRYQDAVRILLAAIAADTKAQLSTEIPPKYAMLAEAYLALGDTRRAADAALKAVSLTSHEGTLFPAARVLLQAGRFEDAEKIASTLENMLQRHTTAYTRLIRGEIAGLRKQPAAMVEQYQEAQKRHNSWFSRFLLGKAYVETNHAPEAIAELQLAVTRRGETTDVYLQDRQTLRYLPPTYYWLARAQESVGALEGARTNYQQYLTLRASASPADPLAADAQMRLGVLGPGSPASR